MGSPRTQGFVMRTAKTLIRLGGCPGWSESSLGARSFCWFCHVAARVSFCLEIQCCFLWCIDIGLSETSANGLLLICGLGTIFWLYYQRWQWNPHLFMSPPFIACEKGIKRCPCPSVCVSIGRCRYLVCATPHAVSCWSFFKRFRCSVMVRRCACDMDIILRLILWYNSQINFMIKSSD